MDINIDIDSLKVGVTSVNIQRTDGRVHPAVVTGVSASNNVVTVEWWERGETKGKEVDLEAIYHLNPELFVQKVAEPLKPKNDGEEKMQTDSAGEEADSSLRKRNENQCAKKSRLVPPRKKAMSSISTSALSKIPAVAALQKVDVLAQNTGRSSSPKISRPSFAQAMQPPAVPSNERLRVSPRLIRRSTAVPAAMASVAVVPVSVANNAPIRNDSLSAKVSAANKKKLSCFKAVEKIAKQRHERRITQQTLRIQREQAYDMSIPNWEFDAMIREFRSSLEYSPVTNTDPVTDHPICVCVRKRPQNARELVNKEIDVVTIPSKDLLLVHEPKTKVDLTRFLENHKFRFDYTFDENSTNENVYRCTAKPLVESIFDNGMATCFAYGQTGSGKTHTMGGEFCSKSQQDCSNGIYFLAASDVFHLMNTKYKKLNLTASASYFEIYSGKVFDLLNGKAKLRILEDGRQQVQIVNLKEENITNIDDVSRLILTGSAVRTSGVTSANNHSSRSHAVFQIILRAKLSRKLHGKFSLVDLAGNERGADTFSSDRQTRTEGAEINKSLLALKECIRALGRDGNYVPFRMSRLTHVLRDSFVGAKSRTCMIAMISPSMSSCEHTLNTLRYADRVKELGVSGSPSVEPRAVEVEQTTSRDTAFDLTDDDDFALLRNSAEVVSQELMNFQNAVDNTQEQEEELIDSHSQLIQNMDVWRDSHERLFKTTDTIDYDVEVYAADLDQLLAQKISSLTAVKEKVEKFRRELANEENLLKTLRLKNNQ